MKVSLRLPRIVPLTAAKILELNSALGKLSVTWRHVALCLSKAFNSSTTVFPPYIKMLKRCEVKSPSDKAYIIFELILGGKIADTQQVARAQLLR